LSNRMLAGPLDTLHENQIVSKFLADSNQAVTFKLVRSVEDLDNDAINFAPGMSHQIFGPKENIFGYANLQVALYYGAASLTQYYNKSYDTVITKTEGGIDPDNIEEKLNEHFILDHESAVKSRTGFEDKIRNELNFAPFGRKLVEFKAKGGRTFELYQPTMGDAGFREWYLRAETFIKWFIDGATYIDTDDDQWDYYTLFERFTNASNNQTQYALAGFSTVFRFYCYPERIRPRISQILIMPPFQKQGLGSTLLEHIYAQYQTKEVLEITMEDPSPDCQRVRDFIDCCNCLKMACFGKDFVKKGFHPQMYTDVRDKLKINKKQARRIYEILRLKQTPAFDEAEIKRYRLDIKNRLNAPHKSDNLRKKKIMVQMAEAQSEDERKRQLQAEYEETRDEYQKVIDRMERAGFF